MSEECFNCVGPASDRYTLILEGSKVLEDKVICDDCVSDFQKTEWITVHDAPIMMRGGKPDQDETEESQ